MSKPELTARAFTKQITLALERPAGDASFFYFAQENVCPYYPETSFSHINQRAEVYETILTPPS